MSEEKAKLELPGKTVELPIIQGTENEMAVDISKLRAESGYITMDVGFGNTGSCRSKITFLNGEKGILKYRGIPIETLCEKSNFLEVSYLLMRGTLPTKSEMTDFKAQIDAFGELPAGIVDMIKKFPKDAHPMGILSSMTVALSAYYPEYLDPNVPVEKQQNANAQMMAQLKTMTALFYLYTQGKDPVPYNKELDYCSDFINQMFHDNPADVDPKVSKAIDTLFILHADHEQNCSASSVRMVGSGLANPYSAISSGINALWGPLHGGANQAVIEMLDAIQADGGDYKKFLEKAKDKNDPFRLMGFGHRVYKNFDPRAKIIKKYCDEVLAALGKEDPTLDIAKGLEEAALSDPYFGERKLYPNVDFYSGIIYRALGIPTNMFTVMFVLGRLPGWIAQWKEMKASPYFKISRPRQIYIGETHQDYVEIDKR